MKAIRFGLLCLALLPAAAWGQGPVQNMDIYFLFGVTPIKAQTQAGSGITLSGTTGNANVVGYGYQVARTKAGGLWVEFLPMSFSFAHPRAGTGQKLDCDANFMPPGIRFMTPVHPRVSIYGILGGGVGFFRYPALLSGTGSIPTTVATTHGVLDLGGGVDVRLIRRLSVRGEVRDYVSGRGLSGSTGPNHVMVLAGIAMHF